jgi:hypothetical protein
MATNAHTINRHPSFAARSGALYLTMPACQRALVDRYGVTRPDPNALDDGPETPSGAAGPDDGFGPAPAQLVLEF